jgi:AcrR family transcriptional regulator
MRVKTEDRRQALMQAALSVFREVGYERASMSEISARAGGSKATLYNYFESKAELYTEAMLAAMELQAAELTSILDPSRGNISELLTTFGISYLEIILSPSVIADKRTLMSQSVTSNLGAIIYDRGDRRAWARVAAYFAQLMAAGELRQGDPMVAALHFQGLLECGMLEPRLYGAAPLRQPEDAAASAVEAFLMIYEGGRKPEIGVGD